MNINKLYQKLPRKHKIIQNKVISIKVKQKCLNGPLQ